MKIIINKNQLKQIIESENKRKLMSIPAELFYDKVDAILDNYKKKGFDGIKLEGDLDLTKLDVEVLERILNEVIIINGSFEMSNSKIKSLGRLKKVDGNLDLENSKIENLGKLESVGGYLDLRETNIEDLGKLEYVNGYLYLRNTPLGKRLKNSEMSKDEIKNKYGVKGKLYL
jgi:hypothetical protein